MKPEQNQFYLLWKGKQSGPFSPEEIQTQLVNGDISRMHQINVDGRWVVVDEFLEKVYIPQREAKILEDQRRRETEIQTAYEGQLQQERVRQAKLEARMIEVEDRSSRSNLPPPTAPQLQPAVYASQSGAFPEQGYRPLRTSGFAIASFVLSICNFIPFINLVSWILALVFGHIALSQIDRDETLGGRGLARAGLIITYFLLLLGATFYVLYYLDHKKSPF